MKERMYDIRFKLRESVYLKLLQEASLRDLTVPQTVSELCFEKLRTKRKAKI